MKEPLDLPVLETKLHRPPLAADFVPRSRLLSLLEGARHVPLTLVSAPAGYGKSTLASSWLERCDRPSAWLSLDEGDGDLAVFLRDLVAAVRILFPGACSRTLALLRAPDLPPVSVLASRLVNDLVAIGKPFVLVLDDYGCIHHQDVHELLTRLLQPPLRNLHLLLLTRRDPPLPLHILRGRGELVEIRQADLEFTAPEAATFLEQATGIAIGDRALSTLQGRTEGWAVGLRLAALSLRHHPDVDGFVREMAGDSRHVQDYLVAEVLSGQPPGVRAGLLKTSILDRLCARLCDVVCAPEIDGQVFLDRLERSNLFCVPLDGRHEWFRYHHLFQDLLRRSLERRFNPEEIADLHSRAAVWLAGNGSYEEALRHLLAAGDPDGAARLVAGRRHDLMNREQWHDLERWLGLLAAGQFDKSPELLLAKAWCCENRLRLTEMVALLDQVEPLVAAATSSTEGELRGELDALSAAQHYWDSDGRRSVELSERALKSLPPSAWSARGYATVVLAFGHQMMGCPTEAYRVVYEALRQDASRRGTYSARLLVALCFVHWMEGDLAGLGPVASRYLTLGEESDLPETRSFAEYFLGIRAYHLDDLAGAERHLTTAVEEGYATNVSTYAHSAFALASTYQVLGQPERARDVVDAVMARALESQHVELLQLARAFQAELALRQGRSAEAYQWARHVDPEPFRPMHRFFVPEFTWARVLLAQGTEASREHAGDLLARLRKYASGIHNARVLIEVLALQALLHDARGQERAALSSLADAVALAEPGGSIRAFLDSGPRMAALLGGLGDHPGIGGSYLRRIQAAFRGAAPGELAEAVQPSLDRGPAIPRSRAVERLTNRELDILVLLGQRLRNKEIADQLSISSETVKRHTANLYQKLGVHGRREAVARAASLGLLPGR